MNHILQIETPIPVPAPAQSKGLAPGAIAGIAVGAGIIFALVLGMPWLYVHDTRLDSPSALYTVCYCLATARLGAFPFCWRQQRCMLWCIALQRLSMAHTAHSKTSSTVHSTAYCVQHCPVVHV